MSLKIILITKNGFNFTNYFSKTIPFKSHALQWFFPGTLLAYGQTASGKTHTIMGDPSDEGIIPRALRDLFVNIGEVTRIIF